MNALVPDAGRLAEHAASILELTHRSEAEVREQRIKERAAEIAMGLHDNDEPLGSMELDAKEQRERNPGVNRWAGFEPAPKMGGDRE